MIISSYQRKCPSLTEFKLFNRYQLNFIESLVKEDGSPTLTLLGLLGIEGAYHESNNYYSREQYQREQNRIGLNFHLKNTTVAFLIYIKDGKVRGLVTDTNGRMLDEKIWKAVEMLELSVSLVM